MYMHMYKYYYYWLYWYVIIDANDVGWHSHILTLLLLYQHFVFVAVCLETLPGIKTKATATILRHFQLREQTFRHADNFAAGAVADN